MSIIIGVICLLFLCISVLLLSSFPISLYRKKHPINRKDNKTQDYYSLLFDVYK